MGLYSKPAVMPPELPYGHDTIVIPATFPASFLEQTGRMPTWDTGK